MAIPARVLKQLGHPSGLAGRFILRMLNRVNANMNQHAREALNLLDQDRVFEIGFGGGALIGDILATGKNLHVTGGDISNLAVKSAQKRYANVPNTNFERLSGEALPYKEGRFTKVVGVNVIYFWRDVPNMLFEISRVLENGGRLVLCYSEEGPKEGTLFKRENVEAQMRVAGFKNLQSTQIASDDTDSHYCTVGIKSSAIPAG